MDVRRLDGRSFLDVGSGSGLFSLAARRLGAKVFSFDFDPTAVHCTRELKRRYFKDDPEWQIEEGSALDAEFLASLGRFDIVYAFGSLHHTGDMWTAIELTADRVVDGGVLYLSIYLDPGLEVRRVESHQAHLLFGPHRGARPSSQSSFRMWPSVDSSGIWSGSRVHSRLTGTTESDGACRGSTTRLTGSGDIPTSSPHPARLPASSSGVVSP